MSRAACPPVMAREAARRPRPRPPPPPPPPMDGGGGGEMFRPDAVMARPCQLGRTAADRCGTPLGSGPWARGPDRRERP